MANYGFVIDQRRCIGCHACTVACKAEHDVPLGVFRTWVKYIEQGAFPDVRRSFAVLRCNHCTDAPCVEICPTRALFKRDDGIVDFDGSRCIGCKACMQACPYDALYIDPDSQTAAKCNFCAHRVEQELAPACEIVCPVHAIVSGDLDDPGSEIAQLVRREQTSVRAPEQGTGPNVFYIGADGASIAPEATRQADAYLWAEIVEDAQTLSRDTVRRSADAVTTYNVAHPAPWRWKVSAYLWTKSIAAGVPVLAVLLGIDSVAAPVLGLIAAAVTGALLVADLKRPERFLYIFLKPNPTSWLVWGAWILVAYCGALVGWIWWSIGGPSWVGDVARMVAVPLGAMAAAYSGFLFNQAEGRDLWQSRLLHAHLLAIAALCGGGAMVLAGIGGRRTLATVLVASAAAHLAIVVLEYTGRHPTENARLAAHAFVRGAYRDRFWLSSSLVAASGLLALTLPDGVALLAAAVAALAGTGIYEDGWIAAGQAAPLS